MLFLDEIYIAHGAWFMALRIIKLEKHLKTGTKKRCQILGRQVECGDKLKSYDLLDKYVILD